MPKCRTCNKNFALMDLTGGNCKACIFDSKTPCNSCGQKTYKNLINGECDSCLENKEKENDREASNVLLTTEMSVELEIVERIDIITAECVFGMNIFKDLFAGVRDIVGGRSGAAQGVLRDARKTVLHELRREAFSLGANAVIAVDLDYSEFSGQGKSMLFVVASGTAVKAKINSEQ